MEKILDSLRSIGRGIRTGIVASILVGLPIAVGCLIGRGCNNFFNNKIMNKPAYYSVSYATGLSGHVEYTRYKDGSQEFKEYPGLGHGFFDSDLCQDFNGDGKIDRIRKNGAEWKMNSLTEILVRESDYNSHKKRFDDADKMLKELKEKYLIKI